MVLMVLMETAREDSQEQSWLGASMQARAEEIESIVCLKCALGSFWRHGHDHECPKFKEKKTTTKKAGASMQARGEEAIQSIFCLKCELGSSWTEGHDDECPRFKETRTRRKKTGASPKARSSRRMLSANGSRQKYSHATLTTTPSVVFTMTTVSKMSSMGEVTTTNTGVYHHHPTPSSSAETSTTTTTSVAAPRLAPLYPSFYSTPLCMVPYNCCFGLPPFYCGKKLEYCNRKRHGGGRRGRPPNCNFNCPKVFY
jgi:hypothetical protein